MIENMIKNNLEPFDIIFMDVDMPVMNGYDACQNLREMTVDNEIYNKMIIIFCTAFEDEQQE